MNHMTGEAGTEDFYCQGYTCLAHMITQMGEREERKRVKGRWKRRKKGEELEKDRR